MRFLLGAAGLVLVLDIASKTWIRANLPLGGALGLITGWIHLQHVQNHGAAWSVLAGHTTFLVLFTLAVIAMLIFSAKEIARQGALSATAFGLILGGALGNFLDRATQGYVTDYFDLDTPVAWLQTFPVFNVADSALTVGVVLILLASLLKQRQRATKKVPEAPPTPDADVLAR
ncbi:lipoprotein signal peptidase [Abditibacteriota bacterium]|nr:lipoprotein signal peptidase [Abditibacteriota bacterium]